MTFDNWSYKNLESLRAELLDLILKGDKQHKETIKEVDKEIEARRFFVVTKFNGRLFTECERFKTKADAEKYKADLGQVYTPSLLPLEVLVVEI